MDNDQPAIRAILLRAQARIAGAAADQEGKQGIAMTENTIDFTKPTTIGEYFSWTVATDADGNKVLVNIDDHIDDCIATGKAFFPIHGRVVSTTDQEGKQQ